jgi:CheY-like chemotaxis protein
MAAAEYVEEAYGSLPPRRRVPDLSGLATIEQVLPLLEDETRSQPGALGARRWALRLGNSRYPNMKLVLEEYLLAGEFVFAVDTHDNAVLAPGDPDGPAWKEIRRWNLALKRRIESRWKRAGLPTYASLLDALRRRAPARRRARRGTVLVVDDEQDIADTVGAVLRAEGYRVLKAGDGAGALEVLKGERPDLILMDYEMPGMKGTEACARIRRSRRDRGIPILLATAAMVDLSQVADADGFLVKPYQRDVLVGFVRHLARRRPSDAGRGAPSIRRGDRGGPLGSSDRPAGGAPVGARTGPRGGASAEESEEE